MASSSSEQLLQELRDCLRRIQKSPRPIKDGNEHLVPLCEALECVFRDGLKSSLFGLNKRDYWDWVEQLPNYIYNEKQNPFLVQTIASIRTSMKMRTSLGRGRCFIRVALVKKILSVPVEHLLKNKKLTDYWYTKKSVIGQTTSATNLMDLLFKVTEIDFELAYKNASFLDETWILPIYVTLELPCVEDLGMVVSHVGNRAIVTCVGQDSLAHRVHIEAGDCIDSVNDQCVYTANAKISKLRDQSKEKLNLSVVKAKLADGTPFSPLARRMLDLQPYGTRSDLLFDIATMTDSLTVQSAAPKDAQLSLRNEKVYDIVYLGKTEVNEGCGDALISSSVQQVVNGEEKPVSTAFVVTEESVTVQTIDGKKKVMARYVYPEISDCSVTISPNTCFGMVVRQLKSSSVHYECLVFETPSAKIAKDVSLHVSQGINRTVWFVDLPKSDVSRSRSLKDETADMV